MKPNNRQRRSGLLLAATLLALFATTADAVRKKDVLNSRHNLSATGTTQPYAPTRAVTATTESQICVFCHTPHGARTTDQGGSALTPNQLWNRRVPAAATYAGYTSSSLDAAVIQAGFNGQPGGSSKLCLSCHDGTLAVNTVNVINGTASWTPGVNIPMSGGYTTIPAGTTGYTDNLGANLTNDHPISVTYNNTLATRDGELRGLDASQKYPAGTGTIIGTRVSGYKPLLPLEGTGAASAGQVQCSACHDPHIVETDTTKGNQKFLRTNRFQEGAPTAAYSQANDIICLTCHNKNEFSSYAYSSHANSLVATQTYVANAANTREFPTGKTVWSASCLNCHDTHTAQGATRLLRDGTDGTFSGGATPAAGGARQTGNKAQENNCYQCHTVAASSAISSTAPLIDIEGEMKGTGVGAANTKSHPNAATTETHDIGGNFNDATFVDCTTTTNKCGADGIEQRSKLGAAGNLTNRHAECTDCHNPHRVAKVRSIADDITGAGYAAGGAHRHEDTTGYTHTNIASGVLRGAWGVEPVYTNSAACRSFHADPNTCISYTVKRGDPGNAASTAVTASYVTREYQVCLKCHSNYGYTDDNTYPSGASRPLFGGSRLTAANTNGRSNYTRYTNQAREFQAPASHAAEFNTLNLGTEAGSENNTANARSWHPVIGPTGRSTYGRYLQPWYNARGTQTMYCSDCHGAISVSGSSVIPDNRSPTAAHTATSESWGVHGGANNMMLKGVWTNTTQYNTADNLCFNCHCATMYGGSTTATCGGSTNSGFPSGDGHDKSNHRVPCMNCHTPVVHGWKNKNFLVNLNDVGPEAGQTIGTNIGTAYSNGPYYAGARLRILTWRNSGQWTSKSYCENVNSH